MQSNDPHGREFHNICTDNKPKNRCHGEECWQVDALLYTRININSDFTNVASMYMQDRSDESDVDIDSIANWLWTSHGKPSSSGSK